MPKNSITAPSPVDYELDIIFNAETDQTYIGGSVRIDGKLYFVYPDADDIPGFLRMLADEIENPTE